MFSISSFFVTELITVALKKLKKLKLTHMIPPIEEETFRESSFEKAIVLDRRNDNSFHFEEIRRNQASPKRKQEERSAYFRSIIVNNNNNNSSGENNSNEIEYSPPSYINTTTTSRINNNNTADSYSTRLNNNNNNFNNNTDSYSTIRVSNTNPNVSVKREYILPQRFEQHQQQQDPTPITTNHRITNTSSNYSNNNNSNREVYIPQRFEQEEPLTVPNHYRRRQFEATTVPITSLPSPRHVTIREGIPLPQPPRSEERDMASSKFLNGISLGLRLFILILIIVAMILVMTAPGVCFWREINGQQTSREICPPSNTLFPMNIDRWNSALHFQLRGQNVWGQLAIIILSVIFVIPPLIFSCVYFGNGRNLTFTQLIVIVLCIIAFLIFGGFETWYATGFDHMPLFIRQIGGGTFSGCAGIPGCETGFVVKGWAAAAAFYFLAAVLFIIDAIIVFMRKDK
uniref:Uncharacterized protein n=1 Tax=Panagrolaimus sp. ES5 TaxID=591445 RepID=A0AC34GTM8_9BILA